MPSGVTLISHSAAAAPAALGGAFSLAGLRVGYVIARRQVIEQLMKLKDSYNLDHLAQVGAAV